MLITYNENSIKYNDNAVTYNGETGNILKTNYFRSSLIISTDFTGDASLKSIESLIFTGDANLKDTIAGIFTGDSNLKVTGTGTFTGDTNIQKIGVIGFAGTITLNSDQQTYGYGLSEDMEFPLDVAPNGTEYPLDL